MRELTNPPDSSEVVINALTLEKLPAAASAASVLLMDARFSLIASNGEAIEILTYPDKPEDIPHLGLFLAGRIRSILTHRAQSVSVSEFESGSRRYLGRAFWLDSQESNPTVALVLQRRSGGPVVLSQVIPGIGAVSFHASRKRNRSAVAEGFTNKEIGRQMNISPDTVKHISSWLWRS